MCPNVRYTFRKIFKLKFDSIHGRIRKYRVRNNLIIYIYIYIFSRARSTLHKDFYEYHRHFKLLQPIESEFRAKFAKQSTRNDFSQLNQVKMKTFKKIKVVKMYARGITILSREDFITEKSLKKLINEQCPHPDKATARELRNILENQKRNFK